MIRIIFFCWIVLIFLVGDVLFNEGENILKILYNVEFCKILDLYIVKDVFIDVIVEVVNNK